MRKLLMTGAAFGCLLMTTELAQAQSIPFTGTYGYTGPFGGDYVWQASGSYPDQPSATDFDITFNRRLDTDNLDFFVAGASSSWTATPVGTNGNEFTAPAGASLDAGESYSTQVYIYGDEFTPADDTFSADWSTVSAVPEPASSALLAAGMFGLGWIRRRKTRTKIQT